MSEYGLHSEFDIDKHKDTFVNYLEVNIEPNGHVLYAIPSHQELAINMACKAKGWTREQLNDACPPEYYFDFIKWVLSLTGCIAVWNDFYIGEANEAQLNTLRELRDAGIYKGDIDDYDDGFDLNAYVHDQDSDRPFDEWE